MREFWCLILLVAGTCSAETNDTKILRRRAHLAHDMVSCVMTRESLNEAVAWGSELFRDLCDEPDTAKTGKTCLVMHWSTEGKHVESTQSLQEKYLRALNIQNALRRLGAAACAPKETK